MEKEPIIRLEGISVSFDGEQVLKDFNLSIRDGEFVTLLGPSGCGKTTTLRAIAGFVKPEKGHIFFDGKDINNVPPHKRNVNTIFQRYALFPHLNVFDNVAFGMRVHGKKHVEEKVNEMLHMVSLSGFGHRSVSQLSGGQQQRVAIARALANDPKVLLLDEPLGALDLKLRKDMQVELKKIQQQTGITFVFVTHDQEEALSMSDTVVVMDKGMIQQIGSPEDIYNEPKNAFVADFIGESNIFDGMKKEGNLIHFAHHDFVCHDDHEPGTRLDVVIRPEDVVLTAPDKGKFTGEVISCLFCGKFYEVAVLSDKNEIEAHILHELTPGTKVGVDFTADTIHTMPKDLKVNHYIGTIDKDGWLELTDGRIPVKEKEPKVHPEGTRLKMYFPSKLAKLSDDPEEGYFQGNIISIIYKGDHYNYRVLSENKVEYSVDDEDLWNIGDFVSVVVPEDAMVFESVSEDAE